MTKRDKEDLAGFVFAIIAIVLSIAVLMIAVALVTMIAWNMVMPDVFGLPSLTTKNAFGLVGLALAFRLVPSSIEGVRK